MLKRNELFASQYDFLKNYALRASEELSFLPNENDTVNVTFAALCTVCFFETEPQTIDYILGQLKSEKNCETSPSLEYEQVFGFYYELITQCEKMPISSEDSGALCQLVATLGLQQLNLDPSFSSIYASFLLNAMDQYDQTFENISNEANTTSLETLAKPTFPTKKNAFCTISFRTPVLWLLLIILVLIIGLMAYLFSKRADKTALDQYYAEAFSGAEDFSLPAFPSDTPSYEAYLKYYQDVQEAISQQTSEMASQKYKERLQWADLPVYVQEGDSCYHLSAKCPNLKTSQEVVSDTLGDAIKTGHPYPCSECAK